MNANELADAMQGVISVLNVHHEEDCLFIANEAQFMLRQQKLEIENLRKADLTQKSLCKAELTKKDVEAARKEGYEFGYAQGCMHEKYGINGTNPIKELTLTDEDILEEWTCKYSECYQDTLIEFAKAILRKAQEK